MSIQDWVLFNLSLVHILADSEYSSRAQETLSQDMILGINEILNHLIALSQKNSLDGGISWNDFIDMGNLVEKLCQKYSETV